jgi:type II secretory ATPase GspE/PulE/Tfp pilus assembly ATPase PilB-like protein
MVYTRLLHQGIEPFLIAAAITGVVAQRLVPGANGKNRIPVASVLETNDSWRDFISRAPGLKQISAELSSYPLGSLHKSEEKMEKAGNIKSEWRLSI